MVTQSDKYLFSRRNYACEVITIKPGFAICAGWFYTICECTTTIDYYIYSVNAKIKKNITVSNFIFRIELSGHFYHVNEQKNVS